MLTLRKSFLSIGSLFFTLITYGQVEEITSALQKSEIEAHIRFLASDELKGRDTGSPELDIAARYIAAQLDSYGIQAVEGADEYFQYVHLLQQKPAKEASLVYGNQSLSLLEDLLVLQGKDGNLMGEVVYVNYGTEEDFEGKDIEGKIVVARSGLPGENSGTGFLGAGQEKLQRVRQKGGTALIELYRSTQIPWNLLVRYLNSEQLTLGSEDTAARAVPYLLLNDPENTHVQALETSNSEIEISISGKEDKPILSRNVIGVIEGTDANLKDEYLLISAHYDHVGMEEGTNLPDSIYNGARDNAVGVTALISAAQYFGQHPPKRSVLFLAVTAEEKGLLGSQWYAEHPLIPTNQVIFNLNTDGAGYNDTTVVTVIGLGRTSADEAFQQATQAVGLEAIADPVPEQNLFDRSDNVNFARQGVPAVTFAPGLTAFDAEIMKYYHQLADEAGSLNFDYVEKLTEAFVIAADKIANAEQKPFWKEGDKYESAGKELYGR
ncbi:M28 family peptidase [Catalinimonas niigatensis]|uniref:M28 family peptidase n=1 Tax=Catalinimonas niigatensis TaxID=1397264 RepID=UPI00266554A3|nr:M28 family peptidase [Catalinimonas niigatensis]WPP48306.1 M28 family peptidase [Catalinimonas niigatensis]